MYLLFDLYFSLTLPSNISLLICGEGRERRDIKEKVLLVGTSVHCCSAGGRRTSESSWIKSTLLGNCGNSSGNSIKWLSISTKHKLAWKRKKKYKGFKVKEYYVLKYSCQLLLTKLQVSTAFYVNLLRVKNFLFFKNKSLLSAFSPM